MHTSGLVLSDNCVPCALPGCPTLTLTQENCTLIETDLARRLSLSPSAAVLLASQAPASMQSSCREESVQGTAPALREASLLSVVLAWDWGRFLTTRSVPGVMVLVEHSRA